MEDSEIIGRVLAGDHAAYEMLVVQHQGRIVRLLERLVGCHETARDLAQETFVAAYRGLKRFENKSAFSTWLYRIASNKAASAARRRRPPVMDHVGEPASREADVAERLEQADRRRAVDAALATLDERFRTVVVLADMEGTSYEQIAETLRIPVGTVRSRLHRARMQLRERLHPLLAVESGRR